MNREIATVTVIVQANWFAFAALALHLYLDAKEMELNRRIIASNRAQAIWWTVETMGEKISHLDCESNKSLDFKDKRNGPILILFHTKYRCEGDCDSDADCQGDLVCYQSDVVESVPGCDGLTEAGIDYCYAPPITATDPTTTTTATETTTSTTAATTTASTTTTIPATTTYTPLSNPGDGGIPESAFPLAACEVRTYENIWRINSK